MRINKKRIGLELLFLFFVFQQPILANTSGIIHSIFSYVDEVIAIACAILLVIHQKRMKQLSSTEKKMITLILVFDGIGILSNIIHPIQSVFLNLSDLLVCNKFLLMYLFGRLILKNSNNTTRMVSEISAISRVICLFVFLLTLHDMFFSPWFPVGQYRLFAHSIQLFFVHPTIYAITNITFACVFMTENAVTKKHNKTNSVFIALALFCAFMSLRTKAIAGVLFIVLAYVYFIKMKMKSKLFAAVGGLSVILLVGWDQLVFFFGKATAGRDDFVRAKLMRDSIKLANDYFPLGTGFATFGSNIAAEHYSPIYQQLGYGLGTSSSGISFSYLSDSFWPIILGQTGWLGLITFGTSVVLLVLTIVKIQNKNIYLFWVAISIIGYELISSVAESAFFHPTSVLLFALLGLVVNLSNNQQERKKSGRPLYDKAEN